MKKFSYVSPIGAAGLYYNATAGDFIEEGEKRDLFPKRGKEIHFTVNGTPRMERGEAGESAVVTMNKAQVGLNTKLEPNSTVEITPSTSGHKAALTVGDLKEYTSDSRGCNRIYG